MKNPKPIKQPAKKVGRELFIEIHERCINSEQSDEPYGDWSRSYDSNVTKISRVRELLDKWSFETVVVSDEVYDASNLYVVAVTYSTGDSFGRSDGHISVALVTEIASEAAMCRDAINEQYNSWKSKTNTPYDAMWRDHPKNPNNGYASWDGYFESVTSAEIIYLPVMG